MDPSPPELPPVGVGQRNHIHPESRSKPNWCNRVSRIAFRLTLLFLGLFLVLAFFALRSLGLWQLGGRANPSTEILAMLAMICLFVAIICGATASIASLSGWWKGK